MNSDAHEILRLLRNPQELPDADWIERMKTAHPAFAFPEAILMKRGQNAMEASQRQALATSILMRVTDHIAMVDFANIAGEDWDSMYPIAKRGTQKTTNEAIEDFLQTFAHTNTPEEDALLEKLIFQPVAPDYFMGLDAPYNPEDPLQLPPELEPTTSPAYPETPVVPPTPAEATLQAQNSNVDAEISHEEPLLRESLAKIYIKQRRYERAFEIINDLSLNYPEKSVYFADQLRFLQKLIINKRNAESKSQSK